MVVSFLKSVENYALQLSGQTHAQFAGYKKRVQKHLKCRKSTLKNKNFEKTKKVPLDILETILKWVYNPKLVQNCEL